MARLDPSLSAARHLVGESLSELRASIDGLTVVLWTPANPLHARVLKDLEAPARTLAVHVQPLKIESPADFEGAFRSAAAERAAALWVFGDQMFNVQRARLAALALEARLPTMFLWQGFVEVGGLMAYAPDYLHMYRRAAVHVDKILRGAKPADLPIEEPDRFELVINLNTAKALGLSIPPAVLARAHRVIE